SERQVDSTIQHRSRPPFAHLHATLEIKAHEIRPNCYCPIGIGGRGASSAFATGSWRNICSSVDNTPVWFTDAGGDWMTGGVVSTAAGGFGPTRGRAGRRSGGG